MKQKVLSPVCGTWKYSAQTISFKHRLCQLSLKTPNHRRSLNTGRSAGSSEETSRHRWKKPVESTEQLCTHTDMAYYHRMSVKLLLKLNIANSWHNPWKNPEPALIQNTIDDADKKMPTAFFGTQKEILAYKMYVNKLKKKLYWNVENTYLKH